MSRSQRDKGNRAERELVSEFHAKGWAAFRTGEYKERDLWVRHGPCSSCGRLCGKHERCNVSRETGWSVIEAKAGKQVPKTNYTWLADNDLLMVRADRMPWLVIQPLTAWLRGGGEG